MWTGDYLSGRVKKTFIFNSYVSWSTERRTAQSALHIMLLRDIQGALQQTEVSNFSSVIMMICSLYSRASQVVSFDVHINYIDNTFICVAQYSVIG